MTEEGDKAEAEPAAVEAGEAAADQAAAPVQAAAVVWGETAPGPDPAGSADAPNAAKQ